MCLESGKAIGVDVYKNVKFIYIGYLYKNGIAIDPNNITFDLKQPLHDNKEEVAFGLCLLSDRQLTDLTGIIAANNNTPNDAKEMSDFLAALDDESDEDSSIDVRPEQPTEPDNPNFDLPDADGMKKVFVAMAKLENSNQQNTESDKKSMLQNIKENFGEKYKNLRGGVKNKVSGTETDEFFFKNVSTALMLYAMIDEELGE